MKKLIFKKHLNLGFIKRMIGWHLKFYLFKRGTPINVGAFLTYKCNARCIMCNVWKIKENAVYPIELMKRDIDSLARIGCYYYSVSGGEPTLVKDLAERLTYAAKKLPYVHLVTNGQTMTPKLAAELGATGVKDISISIDGTEEFHNMVRGLPNAYEKAWNAIDLLITYAPKVQVVVNSLVTPYNIADLRELDRRMDAFPDVLHKYLPISAYELFNNEISVDSEPASVEEIDEFLEWAISSKKTVNSTIFLKKAKLYFRGETDLLHEQKRCAFPYHSLELDSQGRRYLCISGMGYGNGYAPEKSLEEILASREYRDKQRELETCEKCYGTMMLCYYEPRLNFPLHNLIRGKLLEKKL